VAVVQIIPVIKTGVRELMWDVKTANAKVFMFVVSKRKDWNFVINVNPFLAVVSGSLPAYG